MGRKIKEGKLLYHITKLKNLNSIIQHGLLCRKDLQKKQMLFSDIADQNIIEERKDLNEYIPFHFHPDTPFDVAVKNNYKDSFVYICIKREYARKNGFLICTSHPLNKKNTLFSYDDGMKEIDWEIMETLESSFSYDPQVRMAECLSKYAIPIEDVHEIGVKNEDDKYIVMKMFENIASAPYINVRKWF